LSLFTRARKLLSVAVIVAMLFSVLPAVSAAGAVNDDVSGHWAHENLNKWVKSGLLEGYEDGSIQPDRPVTRAELMTLINRAFQLSEKETITFTDLPSSNWAFEQVAIAVKAGYVKGYEDGAIRWNQQVTREEAAKMVADLIQIDISDTAITSSFKDAAIISKWSGAAIAALVDAKIMNGYPNGNFAPKGKFTRAESVTVLENALSHVKPAVEYNKAGVYGPETGTETIKGKVIISAPGVSLRNVVIEDSLILSASVGEGDVHLNKVTVKGTMTIAGGGKNSIHLKDSVFGHIIVNKKDGAVRVIAEGSTEVQLATLYSASIIEESGLTGAGFIAVQLAKELPANTEIKLSGSFVDVKVNSASVRIVLVSGIISNMSAYESANGTIVHLEAAAKVTKLVLDAVLKLTGQGAIENAVVNKGGANTSFETKPNKIEGEGAQAGSSGASGGVGGGDGGIVVPNPDPAENVYEITSNMPSLHQAEVDGLNVDAKYRLIDRNGKLVTDPLYLLYKPFFNVGINTKQNINKPYNGNVRLVISDITVSNGGQAEGLQLFAFDRKNNTFTDIVKAGFGAEAGQTIESLISDFANHTEWSIIAKKGLYKFKIQIVDVATKLIIAESALQQLDSYNGQMKSLSVDGFTLKQKTEYPDQLVGEGFDPNHNYYEIMVPNTTKLNDLKLRVESAIPGASLKVVLEKMRGYDVVASQQDSDGNVYYPIPIKVAQHQYVTIESLLPTGQLLFYSVLVKRLPDAPIFDPNKLDSTDISVGSLGLTVNFINIAAPTSVTISVYDSADRVNLLAQTTAAPNRFMGYKSVDVSLHGLPRTGTVWVAVRDNDTGEEVFIKKEYMQLSGEFPLFVENMPGYSTRLVTAEEVANYNEESITTVHTGIAITFNNELLPETLRNFAYIKLEGTEVVSRPVYASMFRAYHGPIFDSAIEGWTTITFMEFSTEKLSPFHRIVFYDLNDTPLGLLYIMKNPTT